MSLMVGGRTWWAGGGGGGGAGSGKSAVQLLQESKSQYVKSDVVLGSSQRPARPDRFHISSNPNIFLNASAHTLHASRLSPDPPRKSPATEEPVKPSNGCGPSSAVEQLPPVTVMTLTPSALAEHACAFSKGIGGVNPRSLRIQRGAPRPRAKTQPVGDPFNRGNDLRRSLSHGQADRGGGGGDIQMKLRRLLDVGSKEKLFPESPTKVPKKNSFTTNGEISSGTGTFRAEPAKVTVHKSLPDLWKTVCTNDTESEVDSSLTDKRRPSCPSAISTERTPSPKPEVKPKPIVRPPPPIPPRKWRESLRPVPNIPRLKPPEIPKRISLKLPPPRIPPRTKIGFTMEISSTVSNASIAAITTTTPIAATTTVATAITAITTNNSPASVPSRDGCRRSSDSDTSVAAGSDDMRRRPIMRSKSDVTHERCSLAQKDDEDDKSSSRTSLNVEDLENFFESMGLDRGTYQEVISPAEEGLPLYFDEKSSEESGPRRYSSDDEGQVQQAALRPGEPSIIEKNARIIKWLFTCQRAQGCLAQRPATKSS